MCCTERNETLVMRAFRLSVARLQWNFNHVSFSFPTCSSPRLPPRPEYKETFIVCGGSRACQNLRNWEGQNLRNRHIPIMRAVSLMASSHIQSLRNLKIQHSRSKLELLGLRPQASDGRGIDPSLAGRIADLDL
jgi:hypothetical protein